MRKKSLLVISLLLSFLIIPFSANAFVDGVCGQTIDTDGTSVVMQEDIVGCNVEEVVTINADNVQFDCNGYKLEGAVWSAEVPRYGSDGEIIGYKTETYGPTGVYINGDDITLKNCDISVTGSTTYGMGVEVYGCGIDIKDNTITNEASIAISVNSCSNSEKPNTISDNTITAKEFAIQFSDNTGYYTVSDNVISATNRQAIRISYDSSDHLFENNEMSAGGGEIIYITGNLNREPTDLTFTGNTFNCQSNAQLISTEYLEDMDFYNNIVNCYIITGALGIHTTGTIKWDSIPKQGTPVFGPGSKVGGNYWTNPADEGYSDTCDDLDGDFFCDERYELYNGHYDNYPIVNSGSLAGKCVQSNLGRDYYTKGTVTKYDNNDPVGVEQREHDICSSENEYDLTEYYCDGNDEIQSETYTCKHKCYMGACGASAATCHEADDGVNYYEKATAQAVDEFRRNAGSGTDVCVNENELKEYYCDDETVASKIYTCPNGCDNGVCKSEVLGLPNLVVWGIKIMPSFNIKEGDVVSIISTISNRGSSTDSKFDVSTYNYMGLFSEMWLSKGNKLIDTKRVDGLDALDSKTTEVSWEVVVDDYDITVCSHADSSDEIIELKDSNQWRQLIQINDNKGCREFTATPTGEEEFSITSDEQLPGWIMFISDYTTNGAIHYQDSNGVWHDRGVSSAYEVCRDEAEAAGLDGDFIAIISDDDNNIRDRIPDLGQRYVNIHGEIVADSLNDLFTAGIHAPLFFKADGTEAYTPWVWTGTKLDGTNTPNNCENWRRGSNSWRGTIGAGTDMYSASWVDLTENDCDEINRLYCIQVAAQEICDNSVDDDRDSKVDCDDPDCADFVNCIPDADGDGVKDNVDSCLGTPEDLRVPSSGCHGDVDNSGCVDVNDLQLLADEFLTNSNSYADIDHDGSVMLYDLILFADNFLGGDCAI